MSNLKPLIDLMKKLDEEQDMIAWLCTVHRNRVEYRDNADATKRIQEQLNNAVNLISLGYIWAVMEEHGFDENNPFLSEDERLEFKAWKHIRHTGAHAPNSRAKRYFDEFNEFMSKDSQCLSGLRGNSCEFTETSITLSDGMNWRFFVFAKDRIKSATERCAASRNS